MQKASAIVRLATGPKADDFPRGGCLYQPPQQSHRGGLGVQQEITNLQHHPEKLLSVSSSSMESRNESPDQRKRFSFARFRPGKPTLLRPHWASAGRVPLPVYGQCANLASVAVQMGVRTETVLADSKVHGYADRGSFERPCSGILLGSRGADTTAQPQNSGKSGCFLRKRPFLVVGLLVKAGNSRGAAGTNPRHNAQRNVKIYY
jgi:hypothetical protein